MSNAPPTRPPCRWSAAVTSLAAVHHAGVADTIGHISTGGGAALELIEGRTLPGVAALGEGSS